MHEIGVAVTAVKVVVAVIAMVAFIAAGMWLGVWQAHKRGVIPEEGSAIGQLRVGVRRSRKVRRELLTLGERVFAWTMTLFGVIAVPAGIIILLSGDSGLRAMGIGLLIVALVVTAVPVSPILQARVRRRQQATGDQERLR